VLLDVVYKINGKPHKYSAGEEYKTCVVENGKCFKYKGTFRPVRGLDTERVVYC